VSTTELGEFHSLANKFKSLETRLIGLSCDSFANHKEYTRDIIAASKEEAQKSEMAFPLIFDEDRTFAKRLGMMDPLEMDDQGILPGRALYVFDHKLKLRAAMMYPAKTGRNINEVVRLMESLQRNKLKHIKTPVNWNCNDNVIDKEGKVVIDPFKEYYGQKDVFPKHVDTKLKFVHHADIKETKDDPTTKPEPNKMLCNCSKPHVDTSNEMKMDDAPKHKQMTAAEKTKKQET
jgi:1-Cys peroxiredoxin 6